MKISKKELKELKELKKIITEEVNEAFEIGDPSWGPENTSGEQLQDELRLVWDAIKDLERRLGDIASGRMKTP